MKVRYLYENNGNGIIILESVPQKRTILLNNNKGRAFVPFPYLIHAIRYKKDGACYSSGGIYNRCLSTYLSNKPLASINDHVYVSPTDVERNGYTCVDHRYDHHLFPSRKELVKHLLEFWAGVNHDVNIKWLEKWNLISLEKVCETEWPKGYTFPQISGYSSLFKDWTQSLRNCLYISVQDMGFPGEHYKIYFQEAWPFPHDAVLEIPGKSVDSL